MDGETVRLKKKLEDSLREAAEAAVALDRANCTIQGVPHYSVIEMRAHELGCQLSQQIQQRQMAEIVANQVTKGGCPGCGRRRDLICTKRAVTSVDGKVDLQELQGYCSSCRRDFFPAEGDARI